MGAWIEIVDNQFRMCRDYVAPLVGAWIEILYARGVLAGSITSLPLWERGLKSITPQSTNWSIIVAPLVGAWIEMLHFRGETKSFPSLPLWERGLKS